MKPFRERNPVIIGAVGIAVLAAMVLGAFRVADLPLIGGGIEYKAAFRDASGLVSGNEVRIAGVKVGKVDTVELARGKAGPYVRVTFRIEDSSVRLGRDTEAMIRIKTVLGQKYLGIAPAGNGKLEPGAQIPLERTASPFDVVQAVSGLAGTLDQIDTKQLASAFTVLSQTFADTPASVQASLTGLSRLSQTVSERDEQLRDLLTHARSVTSVLANRDEEFRKLVTDGNLLLDEVSRRRDVIHNLLVTTNDLANQLSALVAENRAQLEPALRQLRQVVDTLQRNRANLEHALQSMGRFVTVFANVTGNGRWFDSYVAGMLQPYQPTIGGR
ncbi:MCE family protein [Planosporangium flavigriseum]|uniref:ABC transporter substrate-binding protein n=1 Tax=Planosporangium flavigriseum TaxID=373681 RepID=A0A8J3LPZ6_9ACTN|nr:MCE family protein [Planosporangium flavigriseum]NJC65017.1 MCE family protein [Planosporangium flavigriseum]GIG71631.1 ABC transporter substrate-binding protein [Planosporangium flavigriseum]